MKALLLFLLGVVVGAFGYRIYLDRETRTLTTVEFVPKPTPTPTPVPSTAARVEQTARDLGAQARDAARDTRDAVGEKLKEWKLTPDDLREDLKRGSEIVRTQAKQAGTELSDARILTVIKAKYVLDRDLSALDIDIDVSRGKVTISGKVASPSLVGHAIALALDTDGVLSVASRLTATAY